MSLLTTLHAARRVTVASEGINVVGHNTANATTDGYSAEHDSNHDVPIVQKWCLTWSRSE